MAKKPEATTGAAGQQAATEPAKEQQPAMAKKPDAAAAATGQPETTTGAAGQQQAATEPTETQAEEAAEPSAGQLSAQDVIGTEVVNTKGDQVGEIKDLVIDQDQIEYAVVSVGGFLGIGAKEVAIPLDQLKLGKDQTYLMSAETEAQLEKMPEYKKDQYQSKG
jgi:sporulation protein YlmC with PRC-barrel domain